MSWIRKGFEAWRRWPLWGKVATVVILGAILIGPFIGDDEGTSDAAGAEAASTSTTAAFEASTTSSSEPPSSPTTTTTIVTLTVPPAPTLPSAPSTTAPVSSTTTPVSVGEVATVTAVIDGDTVDVAIEGQGTDTVRLIGINSPEGGECFSAEAAAALQALIADTTVEMTIDQSNRDQYDRLLRYLWLPDGTFVNEELVRGGFAIAREYPPDTAHAIRLEAAQEEAQVAEAGLWAPDACGTTTGEAEIVISGMHPDAAGNDHENKNDEWVDLTNTGTGAVDMTGWVLKDESATHRYRFPSGFTLNAGTEVRIFTGCGTDTAAELYWCNNSAVWNNDGDTAFILDDAGNIVDSRSY